MPFLAILETDLASMIRSWVVRIWLVVLAFQVVVTISTPAEGEITASESMSNLLAVFPLIWSIPIIIISGGAVAGDAGVVADSILSKAVTRYDYILGKLSSRLITVMGIYLAAALIPAYIVARNPTSDLSNSGIAWAIITIGTFLVLLTNLAVTFSTIFNRTLVAVVVTWMLWYGAGLIFSLVGTEYLSPVNIIDNLPATLQGDYVTGDQLRIVAGFGILSVAAVSAAVWHFSRKDL